MTQIGQRAKALRASRGESQEAIARRAGIAVATYARLERGWREPNLTTLVKIAAALEVSPAELIGTDPQGTAVPA